MLAYTVQLRRREIGVRLAIGASARSVRARLLRQSASLVGVGVAMGRPVAWYGAGLLERFLYGVSALDPAMWFAAVGVLASLGLLTTLMPARRATRIPPREALTTE